MVCTARLRVRDVGQPFQLGRNVGELEELGRGQSQSHLQDETPKKHGKGDNGASAFSAGLPLDLLAIEGIFAGSLSVTVAAGKKERRSQARVVPMGLAPALSARFS